jgi:hypothetical protein
VVRLDAEWQNILGYTLALTWFVVGVVLSLRALMKQLAYLGRFPPVNGVPLNALRGGNPFGARARMQWRVSLQRQSDPELEGLRRETWRRFRAVMLWIYGFPIVVIGVAALLIATSVVILTEANPPQPIGPGGGTVSRAVVASLQMAGFVPVLVSSLLIYSHFHRLVRALATAGLMAVLGVLALQPKVLPTGPAIPRLLFVVGFLVAVFAPPVRKVGTLTENQVRAIGFVLAFLGMLAAFFLPSVLASSGVKFG